MTDVRRRHVENRRFLVGTRLAGADGMNAFHLVFQAPGRFPFSRDRRDIRGAVRAIVRVCGKHLLVFHVSDTHVHVVVLCDRARAGRLAQALGLALAARAGAALPPASVGVIRDVDHLRTTFAYVLCNDEKHGVVPDPWRENSNLPDLLGARLTAAATIAATRRVLPRVKGEYLRELAGWPDVPAPARLELSLVRAQLADAAAAIVAGEEAGARLPLVVAARTAAGHLGAAAGIPVGELARLLGVDARTLFRYRKTPPKPALLRALERQLFIRGASPLPQPTSFGDEPSRPVWRGGPRRDSR